LARAIVPPMALIPAGSVAAVVGVTSPTGNDPPRGAPAALGSGRCHSPRSSS
jgi:hypothetical protein